MERLAAVNLTPTGRKLLRVACLIAEQVLFAARYGINARKRASRIGSIRPWGSGIVCVSEKMKAQLPAGLIVTKVQKGALVAVLIVFDHAIRIEARQVIGPA